MKIIWYYMIPNHDNVMVRNINMVSSFGFINIDALVALYSAWADALCVYVGCGGWAPTIKKTIVFRVNFIYVFY